MGRFVEYDVIPCAGINVKFRKNLDEFYRAHRTPRHLKRLRKRQALLRRKAHFNSQSDSDGLVFKEEFSYAKVIVGADGLPPWSATSRRSKSPCEIKLPKKFSIIDDPQSCLEALQSFRPVFENVRIPGVLINHQSTREHDLASEILLAKVAKNCMELHRSKGRSFVIDGQYPESERLCRLIRSIGIVKELEVEGHTIDGDANEHEKLVIFKRRSSTEDESSVGSMDYKTKATQDFVEHIDCCLQEAGSQLKDTAKQDLAEYVGEIVTNAQEHSGTGHWQIFGYLDKDNEDRVCEVVIFNYGDTIADTFKRLPQEDFARTDLNRYLSQHKEKGILGAEWEADTLTTLFALQGSVSSKNQPTNSTRGHGTVSLIEFFQTISEGNESDLSNRARMCILSGEEHIRFDGKYRLNEDSGRPIIAFNQKNDLRQAPDRKYVRKLNNVAFPGTLIAIQFILPETATEEIEA